MNFLLRTEKRKGDKGKVQKIKVLGTIRLCHLSLLLLRREDTKKEIPIRMIIISGLPSN